MYNNLKYVKHNNIGDIMRRYRDKILYCFALVVFLFLGIGVGYVRTKMNGSINLDENILDYALNYSSLNRENYTVPASTMVVDVEVIYEDCYLTCGESVSKSKMVYGTTIDTVKEEERKFQEEQGLIYAIKAEGNTRIIYTRNLEGNCPNHFLVKNENDIVTVYTIKGEDKKEVYMTLTDVNISNLRGELKTKVEKGTYINSREELNKFIEDLET